MVDIFLFDKIIYLFSIIIGFWLSIWVYVSGRQKKENIFFSAMVIIWILGVLTPYFIFRNFLLAEKIILFLPKIEVACVFIFFIIFYYFSIYFLSEEKKFPYLDKIILVTASSGFILSIFTDLFQQKVILSNEGIGLDLVLTLEGKIGWLGFIFIVTFFILHRFIINYLNASYNYKAKIQYFLTGLSVWILLNLVFNVYFPLFKNTFLYASIGNYSIIILFIFTAYAIVKHELMGIKTLLTQVLLVVISIILLVDVFFLSDNPTMQLLKLGILLAFLYFSREMVKSAKKEKEAREELEKINRHLEEKTQDLESLLTLNEMVSSTEEIENSVQNIMDAVPLKLGHLGIIGTLLIRYNEKTKKACAYITTESDKIGQAKKLLAKPALSDYCSTVKTKNTKNQSLIIKSILNNKIEAGLNFADFVSSVTLPQSTAIKIQKSLGAKAFVSVPITIRGKKKGALVFIFIKDMAEISQRDFGLITAFTQHVSVVMDNLHFYHHLNKNIEELTRAKDKLKEMLVMKNDFLHIVSHQLRTPLTAMRGFISMWNEGDFDSLPKDKMGEVKTRIVNNSERLNNIVNDMVMAMESEGELKIEFKPIDIGKILAGNIEMLKSGYEKKGLYLEYKETTKNIPAIEADEKLLLNVFMNLIDNAEKYTDKGGLTISVGQDGDNVKISFIDTGIGLTKEDKKILFKKFSRGAKSNYINPNGSGLGLFIIKQIIRKHHGEIKAASKGENKGATFTITLPVKQGK